MHRANGPGFGTNISIMHSSHVEFTNKGSLAYFVTMVLPRRTICPLTHDILRNRARRLSPACG